jgi:hypothetical protein
VSEALAPIGDASPRRAAATERMRLTPLPPMLPPMLAACRSKKAGYDPAFLLSSVANDQVSVAPAGRRRAKPRPPIASVRIASTLGSGTALTCVAPSQPIASII